jgi:predicted GIY-YIG superfamily endonuclease
VSKPAAVYRFWDASDTLLYIGVTENPDARFGGHESTKPWWPDVARKAIEWHENRVLADAAETEAIGTERSLYNVAGSPWAPKPRELAEHEMTISEARANLTEIVDRARLARETTVIVDRRRDRNPVVAVVPVDLWEAIKAVGGPDAALKKLAAP